MKNLFLIGMLFLAISCDNKNENSQFSINKRENFKPETYQLRNNDIKQVKGQIVYLPIYSNIQNNTDTGKIDMSAFVAVHNTDFKNKIKLLKVQYFDTDGKLVHDFLLNQTKELNPLQTTDFYIPYKDQSGTGANFLIEWISDSLVTEPLFEAITLNLLSNNTVAVLSQGKVIKERIK